jgi:hypothetical protein
MCMLLCKVPLLLSRYVWNLRWFDKIVQRPPLYSMCDYHSGGWEHVPPSSGFEEWRWRRHIPPKRRSILPVSVWSKSVKQFCSYEIIISKTVRIKANCVYNTLFHFCATTLYWKVFNSYKCLTTYTRHEPSHACIFSCIESIIVLRVQLSSYVSTNFFKILQYQISPQTVL